MFPSLLDVYRLVVGCGGGGAGQYMTVKSSCPLALRIVRMFCLLQA